MARSRSTIDFTPDNIYYNASMYNPSLQPVPANYIESRTTPILTNPSDYYLSVIRFSIPGILLPIFVAQTLDYGPPYFNTDPLVLEYSVTLTHNGTTSGETFLRYDPNYNTLDSPIVKVFTPDQPTQNPLDPYYYMYSYQWFIDFINTALATAYSNLPDKGTTTQPPYLVYDPTTELISLFAQQSYFQNSNPQDPSNTLVWFNNKLYDFFPSFNVLYNGRTHPTPDLGKDFAIVIKNNHNNTPSSPTGYYQMTQEYSTLYSWNHLQSISFRSSSIPVVQEYSTGVSPIKGQTLQGTLSGNQISFITDFEPFNSGNAGIFREWIQYYPSGEYRLTDMIGTQPLQTIDIQCYWTDIFGVVHPLYIGPGADLTLKILFRKKSFYSDARKK